MLNTAIETCPSCEGEGEIETGEHERETGAAMTATCVTCDGTGDVEVEEDFPDDGMVEC